MATDAPTLAPSRNRRMLVMVALAAALAAGAVVGVTLLQTRGERATAPGAVTTSQSGRPPLQLEFGLRRDAEARALAEAQGLFDNGHQAARANAIFRRYHSLEAELGAAFTSWNGPSSLAAVQALVAEHPNDPAGLVNLGWADYWAGHTADAVAAWQKTEREYADSPYGVDAETALYLPMPRGLPPIVTGLTPPRSITSLPPAQELAALKRAASRPDVSAKLLYGYTLWFLKRRVSAERQFAAAARLAPHDALARTLAAVGLFSKAHPARAFGKLGPLTAVFPNSPVVEFHLGVLLVYVGENTKAAEHLRAAVADGRGTSYAADARTLLASLPRSRSK